VSIYISSITVGTKLKCQLDLVVFQQVRWFGGLTCVFWAENGENKLMGDKNNEMRGFGESPGGEADFSAPLFTKGAASVEMTIRWFGCARDGCRTDAGLVIVV